MDKAKVLKLIIKGVAIAGGTALTVLNNKISKDEMDEAVAKKVAEALANQAEES